MRAAIDDVLSPPLHVNGGPLVTAPEFARHGDQFCMAWSEPPVGIFVSAVRERGDGLHAEVTVIHSGSEIHWGDFKLASTAGRESLVKKLVSLEPIIPWRPMLEQTRGCAGRMAPRDAYSPVAR